MSKIVFIIGMRRAGTSILRTLVNLHPEVQNIEFEPHDLMYSVGTHHLQRYRNCRYHKDVINRFKHKGKKYRGAKIVCNPYLSALGWKFLKKYYPGAKYIFTQRNWEDNYKSWYQTDKNSIRGVMPKELYKYFYDKINQTFKDYHKEHPNDSCILKYENLVANADKELKKAWKMLGIKEFTGLNKRMKKPTNWSKNEN